MAFKVGEKVTIDIPGSGYAGEWTVKEGVIDTQEMGDYVYVGRTDGEKLLFLAKHLRRAENDLTFARGDLVKFSNRQAGNTTYTVADLRNGNEVYICDGDYRDGKWVLTSQIKHAANHPHRASWRKDEQALLDARAIDDALVETLQKAMTLACDRRNQTTRALERLYRDHGVKIQTLHVNGFGQPIKEVEYEPS